ncbi:hypothetical protein PENSUB_13605 [Penicillium subrubescens]|uniref:Uncharacterized protein n=1 Tax=Penicillium subrubescens TaxID=1316194 RepID=A0A1Q5SNF4_9EURO|nr:hypothetical protein PENSUB_13605 [Penicillium subrubescens]
MNDPFSQRKLNLIQSDKPGKNFETVAYINSAVKRAKFKQEANRSHGLGRDSRYEKARTKPENGQHSFQSTIVLPVSQDLTRSRIRGTIVVRTLGSEVRAAREATPADSKNPSKVGGAF